MKYFHRFNCLLCKRKQKQEAKKNFEQWIERDRELNVGFRNIKKHLDIESIIKLNQKVRALEALILNEDDDRLDKQHRILGLNRFNYLTSGDEDHHLLDEKHVMVNSKLITKAADDVKFLLEYEVKDSIDEKLLKLMANRGPHKEEIRL